MQRWIALCCLLAVVNANPEETDDPEGHCASSCVGEAYVCVNGRCFCADGYILNVYQMVCVKCPGSGEPCFGRCCNGGSNDTLQCFKGTCQRCYDSQKNWICRDPMDQILIVTISQVAMGTALVLGVVATLLLLTKFCSATNLRSFNSRAREDSRLSIGSLQGHVEQRLRDAPPRYARTPPPDASICPAPFFVNAGFIHDSSVPPPPYEDKNERSNNPTLHI